MLYLLPVLIGCRLVLAIRWHAWFTLAGYIYFKQQLTGNAWYGVGLNNASMMAGADFMVFF